MATARHASERHRGPEVKDAAVASPRHRLRRTGGVSLLELILTLAIVAVTAAIAVPRYGAAAARYQLDLAARRVAADLRLARSYARTASASRMVIFDAATEQYRVPDLRAADGAPGDYTVVLSAEPYRADLILADFAGVAQVVFDGWGVPKNGGQVIVAVGARQRTIMLDDQTGQVSIQ